MAHEGFAAIGMTQQVTREPIGGAAPVTLTTTRSPLRIDGERLLGSAPSPRLWQDTERVRGEFADRAMVSP